MGILPGVVEMSRMSKRSNLYILFIFLSLTFPPVPAPFPKGDLRAIFNPLIEPWWCIVPKFVRQALVLKYFGTPLVEEGPCSVDPGQHAPQGEPEGEPESEPEKGAEPEPKGKHSHPEPEPEPEREER